MNLAAQIDSDLKEAMKARDKERLEALRNIKKVMIEARSAKGAGSELTDDEVLKIISKLAKQGDDSAEIYRQQGRDDLFLEEMKQVKVYRSLLPSRLTDSELSAAIREIIERTGAASMQDMGRVMAAATKELGGKADGKDIAAKVRSMLQQ